MWKMLNYWRISPKSLIIYFILFFNIILFGFLAKEFMEFRKMPCFEFYKVASLSFIVMICVDKLFFYFLKIQSFLIMNVIGVIIVEMIQYILGISTRLHSISAVFLSLSLCFFIVFFKQDFIARFSKGLHFFSRRFIKCLMFSLFLLVIHFVVIFFMGSRDYPLFRISILILLAGYTVSSVYGVIPFLKIE